MIRNISAISVRCSVSEGGRPSEWTLSAENSAFSLQILRGTATFTFKHSLPSFDEAERQVNDFLSSWEADALLQTGRDLRDFQVTGCSAPGHGSRADLMIKVTSTGADAEAATRQLTPWRRHRYWHLPLIASLIARYEDYRKGRERLAVLGYLCLTALERALGGRQKLATALLVDYAIL